MVTRPRSCGGAHRRLVAKVLQRAEGVNRSAPSHTAARAELGEQPHDHFAQERGRFR